MTTCYNQGTQKCISKCATHRNLKKMCRVSVVQAGVVGGDGDIFLTPSFGTKEQQLNGFNVVNVFLMEKGDRIIAEKKVFNEQGLDI